MTDEWITETLRTCEAQHHLDTIAVDRVKLVEALGELVKENTKLMKAIETMTDSYLQFTPRRDRMMEAVEAASKIINEIQYPELK